MISLLFSPEFPDPLLASECFTLVKNDSPYTIGRPKKDSSYSINLSSTVFTRAKAILTVSYSHLIKEWQLSDSGINSFGEVVPYEHRCQVNGSFITRRGEVPDPVTICPGDKILIGGNPDLKILVLPECDITIPGTANPFEGDGWGDDVWELITDGPLEDVTVGTPVFEINNNALSDFLNISRMAGHGLANPQTRLSTMLTIICGLIFLIGVVGIGLFADSLGFNPMNPGSKTHQDTGT